MTHDGIIKAAEFLFDNAAEFVVEHQSLPHILAVMFELDDKIAVGFLPPPEDKHDVQPVIQALADRELIRGFFILSECWAVTSKIKDDTLPIWMREHESLEEHPNRMEYIIGYLTAPGLERVYTARMIRHEQTGKVIACEAEEAPESVTRSRFRVSWRAPHEQ